MERGAGLPPKPTTATRAALSRPLLGKLKSVVKNNIFFYICVLKMSRDDSAEDPDLQRTEKTAEGRTCKETAKS